MSATTFEKFFARYRADGLLTPSDPVTLPEWAANSAADFQTLMNEYAGSTFNAGIYRFLSQQRSDRASELIHNATRLGRLVKTRSLLPFASDWLGRIFVLGDGPSYRGEPCVLLVDFIEDQAYELDANVHTFHEEILIEDAETFLAKDLFDAWALLNRDVLPIRPHQIVGYRIPLALGGKHEIENLELVDEEVEVGLTYQIAEQIADVTEGSRIGSLRLRDPREE